ncbi:MAG: hypothetical protein QW687_00875 [Candidatus Hadarchaeales archaeon]
MSVWSYQVQKPTEGAIRLLIGGNMAFVNAIYNALAGDARFDIASLATDPDDLRQKTQAFSPEAVVIEASIFHGPEQLIGYLNSLGTMSAACYVILPPEAPADAVQSIGSHKAVSGVWLGRVSFIELGQKIRDDVETMRNARLIQFSRPAWEQRRIVGTQILGIWNQVGGKGGTTIASNLAYYAAQEGIATLLIGLGGPDDLPLILGLSRFPNILMFKANPTPEGFRASIQKKDLLDVIGGFPDALSASEMAMNPDSIKELVDQAIYANYALIILDIPQQEIAPLALTVCNSLLIVAKPTLADTYRAAEAYITVTERLQGKHRIPVQNIRIVLNFTAPDSAVSPDEWRRMLFPLMRGKAIPAMSVISYDPKVPQAQNAGKMPVLVSDGFRKQIARLAEELNLGMLPKEEKTEKARVKIGGITLKLR